MGITVPRQWGGAEVSAATRLVIAIISAADPSLGQIPQNHYRLLEDIRLRRAAQSNRPSFGPVLQGIVLPTRFETGGKTVLDIRTRPETRGEALYINGRKGYCTGSLYAHWIGILALDADDRAQLAFVPRDSAGLTVLDDWDCLGQRNTASGTVLAENLAVARCIFSRRGNLMPRRRSPAPSRSSPPPRLMPGSPAQPSTTPSASFASSPDRGLMPASNGPATIRSPSTISGRSTADWPPLRRLLEQAGKVLDRFKQDLSEEHVAQASIAVARAKVFTTEVALDAASRLFELSGTRATGNRHNFDRHWRNARVHTLHDPVRWKYQLLGNWY